MANKLPDLDAEVAFIAVDGDPVGPIAMREIVKGVASAKYDTRSLIWWVDAPDWSFFDEHEELMGYLPAVALAPPDDAASHDPYEAESARERPSLTGLFSASARREHGLGGVSSLPTPAAMEAITSARSSLESVGSRLEVLSGAARTHSLAAALAGPAAAGAFDSVAPVGACLLYTSDAADE